LRLEKSRIVEKNFIFLSYRESRAYHELHSKDILASHASHTFFANQFEGSKNALQMQCQPPLCFGNALVSILCHSHPFFNNTYDLERHEPCITKQYLPGSAVRRRKGRVSDILRPKLLLFLIRHVCFYRQRSRPCRAQRRRRHRPESLGGVFVRRTGIAVLAIAVFESDSALVEAEEGSRTASK